MDTQIQEQVGNQAQTGYIYIYTRVLWVYVRAVRDPLKLLWVEVSVHLCKTDQFSIGEYRLRLGFCCWEPKQRETYKSLRHSDQPVYMRVSARALVAWATTTISGCLGSGFRVRVCNTDGLSFRASCLLSWRKGQVRLSCVDGYFQ